jgi:hypothetical protein
VRPLLDLARDWRDCLAEGLSEADQTLSAEAECLSQSLRVAVRQFMSEGDKVYEARRSRP